MNISLNDHPGSLVDQQQEPNNQNIQLEAQNNKGILMIQRLVNKDPNREKWHEFVDEQQEQDIFEDQNGEQEIPLVGQKETSLREKLQQIMNDNQETLMKSIRLRYIFRIIVLLIITLGLLKIFWIIKDDYAFYSGYVELGEDINLNIQNCKIIIEDKKYSHIQRKYEDFLENEDESNSNDDQHIPDILLEYYIPGRFNIDPFAAVSTVNITQNSSSFINILSTQNCRIKIFVLKQIQIKSLILNCSKSCYIIQKSQNITYSDININGDLIESNFNNLVANNINYQTTQGRFQGNRVTFKNFSNINIESGDIIIQTDQEIQLNWTHAIPNYCLSAPVVANPIVIGCEMPKDEDIKKYLTGIGSQNKEDQRIKNNDEISEESEEETAGEEEEGEEEEQANYSKHKQKKTFFEDNEGDPNIFLFDELPNYEQTRNYQNIQKKLQQEFDKGSKKKIGKFMNLNIHLKKVKHNQEAQLFNPSCYGSILLCQSEGCSNIQNQYYQHKKQMKKMKKNRSKSRILNQKFDLFQDFKEEESEKAETSEEEEDTESQGEEEEPQNGKQPDNKDQKKPKNKESYDSQARAMLPHEITEGIPFLNLTGRFGNIYVNIINQSIIVNDEQTVVYGSAYKTQNINFSLPSIKKIYDAHQDSKNPHNFDPSFIFGIGSKQSESDNYQQWQLTFNPAYSYLRPWWIGTFSFTLLSTSTYPLELQLSPGFCPYVPTADIRHLYQTGYLINGYFPEAEHSINTYSIQDGLDMPIRLNYSTQGFKFYLGSNNVEEKWYQISKINETNYKISSIDLSQSPATEWAVKVSIILSMITALILLIGLIYIIIQVYDAIVNQVESIKKYGDIEQKDEDKDQKQPLMEIKQEQQEGSKEDKENDKQEVAFTFNPLKMIYFLLVKAPPLSAFIDYLFILITKKFRNSAEEFYSHLFQEKDPKQDSEDVEQMLSIDFKTLYEKFCYLNGFLEQKLDDSDNVEYLRKYGFCINEHLGAQTECNVRVLFDKMVKLTDIPQNKTSYQLFIEKCCRLTNFDQDCFTLQSFNERYDEFCITNHLKREIISNIQLKEYNIETKFIPLQYVERINKAQQISQGESQEEVKWYKKCYNSVTTLFGRIQPEKKIYVINQKKLENHFYLIMDNIQLIKTREELLIANREIILYPGWFISDFFTVLFHFFTTIILIIPLFSFTILEKILYYPYSLIPSNNLISQEDIFHNIWLIPDKLSQESAWIRNILILVMIYWIYSIIDLIYYYLQLFILLISNMEFPQEKFFRKTQQVSTNRIQFIFRQIMWILVLYSAYQLFVFLSLAGVWLVLGGIVNPSAFLPYATAAATFITVVVSKASQYKEIAEEGFHAVIEYVEQLSNDQFAGLLKKYDIKKKINRVLDNQAVGLLADAAAGMGLVDQDIIQHIKQGVDQATKVNKKGGKRKLKQLQEDPQTFFDDLKTQMEDKAKNIINTQISKQINVYGEAVAQLIVSMTDENLEDVKNNIINLFLVARSQPNSQQFESLNSRTLPLIFQLAETFTKSENNNDTFIQPLLQNIAECLSQIILSTIQQDKLQIDIDRENLQQSILKSLQIESNLQQFNTQQIYNDFQEILQQQGENKVLFQRLLKFAGLLQLTVTLFEGKRDSVPFHSIMKQIQTYFLSQNEFREMKNILGYFDLILNSFKKQLPLTSPKQTLDKIEQFYQFSIHKFKQHKDQATVQKIEVDENVQLVTLWFNYISNNFEKVPNSIIQEYITQLANKPDNKFLQHFFQVQGETKQFVDLFSNMLNMMTLFMDRSSETKKIYQQPQTSFQIEPDRAKALIQFLQFSTKMTLTQENSQKENELVVQFSDTNIFQSIQNKLRISKQLLLGITMFLLNKFKRPEFQFLLDSISALQKIDVRRVKQFVSMVIIQLSDNEQYLADAVQNLCFPKEFAYFMLNIKKVETIPYFYDSLIKLGFSETQIQEIKDQLINADRQQILRQSLFDNYDVCYDKEDSNSMTIQLLTKFYYLKNQQKSLDLQFTLESLSNNENQFLLLTNQEINLAKQIIQLGGIKFEPSSDQLVLIQKQSIQELSAILNVNKDLLEDYVNLLFVNNTNQSMKILKSFQESEEIVIIQKEQQYHQLINYISSKTLLLNKKQEKLKQAINKIIPQGLPFQLINKVLINKYQSIDIATFYQCTSLIIPQIQNFGQISYEYINRLNPIVKFMTNAIQLTESSQIKEFLNKNELSEGICNLIKIQSEVNLTSQLQLLINHLQMYQIQNQYDKENTVPQFFLTHLCLYLFFRGKHQQLQLEYQHLSNISEQKNVMLQVNVLEYVNLKYNIAPEFFQSIHAIFLKDKQQFIQVMTKFNRKYQQLQIMDEGQKKQIVPLQSLFKVQDTLMINLLNLLDGDFQPNYFAKQLKINKQLLDFIAALSKIKINQDNQSYRRIQINYLQKSYQQTFDKLQLDQEEFILILQLLYQDISSSQVNQIIQLFGLEGKINQSILLNLMHIDRPYPLEKGKQECLKQMNFGSNNLLDQLGLNKALVSATKILIGGATSLMDKVFVYYPQFSPKLNQQYLDITKSLVSCISGQMNDSNLNLKEYQSYADKAVSDQAYKPEFLKETFNGQEQAIFMFNKYFKVPAVYLLQQNGQESFWKMIKTIFSGTYQEQVPCIHPLIVLESYLVFYNIPLVMKKMMTDYLYQKYLKRLNKEFNKEEKIKKPESRVTRTEFKKLIMSLYQDQLSFDDLEELKQRLNIKIDNLSNYGDDKVLKKYQNRAVFRSILDIDKFVKHTPLEEPFQYLKSQIENNKKLYRDVIYEDLIEQIMKDRSEEIKQQMKEMKPYLIFCYQKLSLYWYSGQVDINAQEYETNENFKSKANSLIIDSDFYNHFIYMFYYTELFSLRNIQNQSQSDINQLKNEDLQKIVILKLDYILTFMERFFFFQEFVDFMSKNQLIQLLGLSAGFVLTTEDIIKAKLTEQLFDYKFSQQYLQLKSSTPNKQILYKFNFMLQVYINQDSQLYSRKKTIYKYNKILNQNDKIVQHPEFYFTTQQEGTKLDFKDYFLDLPLVDDKSEIYKYILINGKQLSSLKHHQIQDEIQICINQMFSQINNQRQNKLLSLQEIKDPKTGLDWKQQLLNLKNWKEQTSQENFKLVLAILKRNYQYMLDSNSILMQQPISAQIYYGMIALQGAQLKKQQGWNELGMRQLQQYVNSFTTNCKSNKKVLLELIGIFVGSFQYPYEISEIYQQESSLIFIMIVLACNLNDSIFQDIDNIKYHIFRYLQLLPIDEQCLENTLRIYAGDTSIFNLIGKYNKVLYQKKTIKTTDDLIMKKRSDNKINQEELNIKINNEQKDIEKYYDYLAKSNQLLDSFNPNYYHKLENIDFSQLDFFQYIIQSKNDTSEYIYLIAQHLTKDIDYEIFKYRVNLNYTDTDWGQAVEYVRQLNKFYDDYIDNSSSSIQGPSKQLIELLTSMKLIQNEEELEIVKGISALQSRYYQKNQSDKLIEEQLKIVNSLNLTKLDNQEESKQIEQLYIGLCQNQFPLIYASILQFNKLQAANLLSIFYMKHFNIILHFLGLKNVENYQFMETSIMYHLLLFQLNTYSKTIEILAKNKQKLNYVREQRKLIINCTYQILTKIDQLYIGKDPREQIRDAKQKLKELMNNPKTSNYNKSFSWSHWIISYPQLNDYLDKYIAGIDPQFQEILFQSKQFFKILMGIELHETIRQGELFSSTVINYVDLSKIFSYPLLLNQQVDLSDLHRSYMKIFKSKMNHEQIKYINLFDKFIEIIILTQIPSTNLNLLELKLKKQDDNSQNESQKQLQDDDDDDKNDNQEDQEDNKDGDDDDQQEDKIQHVVNKFKKLLKDPIKSANDFDILISNKIQLQIQTIIQELLRLYQQEDQIKLTQQINQLREEMIATQEDKELILQQINQLNFKQNGLEKEYDEIQYILNKLVELFSGFTISQGYSQQKVIYQRDKNKQINDLIDQMLFINIKVQDYISTKITNSIYQQLINLSNSPIMSIADSEYQEKVLILLHVMTNQEPYSDEMKQKFQERKIYRGNQVQETGRKQLMSFPIKTILAIFDILQFKMNGVGRLLQELSVGEQSIKFVMQNLNQMEKMGVFDQQQELVVEEEAEDEKVQKAMELMKKVEKGEASSSDLFKFVDEDQSNSISKQEYKIIAKRLGMDLSDHRVNEIFASFKKGQQNQNDESQMDNLNEREFEKAMEYLRSKNTNMSLDFLGISSGLLTIMLIIIAIIMILTFVFVFLGIKAFALGGTFGAIINSFIPIAAGGSASGKAEKIDDSRRNKQSIKESVEKTQQIIQSSQL